MVSALSWLDSSRDEQRRMRELLNLFAETENRDELGIGQIRDAFSDLLFPGTSTLHTRARYLIIVPWCYLAAIRRRGYGVRLAAAVDANERAVIRTLKNDQVTDGLIGRLAGVNVQTLPSTIYWTALRTYGILLDENHPGTPPPDNTEELADRTTGMWHPDTPAVPEGFPTRVPGGLDLTAPEAEWLRYRILATTPQTLLAHLVDGRHSPAPDSRQPWQDPATTRGLPDHLRAQLLDAELFSLAMHGAALLYNLLIAHRYEKAGHSRVPDPVEDYRGRLRTWSNTIHADPRLPSWDRDRLWRSVTDINPRIATNLRARDFVDQWITAIIDGTARAATKAADPTRHHLADLIAHREQTVKKSQSRLTNAKLLATWSGESGSNPLVYRWPQVRRAVRDIHTGLTTPRPER